MIDTDRRIDKERWRVEARGRGRETVKNGGIEREGEKQRERERGRAREGGGGGGWKRKRDGDREGEID